jgi:hypothetical protein
LILGPVHAVHTRQRGDPEGHDADLDEYIRIQQVGARVVRPMA